MASEYQNITILGLRELNQRLAEFPKKIENRLAYHAVAKGASVIRDAAIHNAEFRKGYSTGLVRSHIIQFKPRKKSRGLTAEIDVGVKLKGRSRKVKALRRLTRKGRGNSIRSAWPAYYWFMLEYGTSKMAAQPFLRPAVNKYGRAAIDAITEDLRLGIDKEASKP